MSLDATIAVIHMQTLQLLDIVSEDDPILEGNDYIKRDITGKFPVPTPGLFWWEGHGGFKEVPPPHSSLYGEYIQPEEFLEAVSDEQIETVVIPPEKRKELQTLLSKKRALRAALLIVIESHHRVTELVQNQIREIIGPGSMQNVKIHRPKDGEWTITFEREGN